MFCSCMQRKVDMDASLQRIRSHELVSLEYSTMWLQIDLFSLICIFFVPRPVLKTGYVIVVHHKSEELNIGFFFDVRRTACFASQKAEISSQWCSLFWGGFIGPLMSAARYWGVQVRLLTAVIVTAEEIRSVNVVQFFAPSIFGLPLHLVWPCTHASQTSICVLWEQFLYRPGGPWV